MRTKEEVQEILNKVYESVLSKISGSYFIGCPPEYAIDGVFFEFFTGLKIDIIYNRTITGEDKIGRSARSLICWIINSDLDLNPLLTEEELLNWVEDITEEELEPLSKYQLDKLHEITGIVPTLKEMEDKIDSYH